MCIMSVAVNLIALFSCYAVTLFFCRGGGTSSLRLLSDDNSSGKTTGNFSLRQRLHLLLTLLWV